MPPVTDTIAVVGDVNVDIVASVDRLPALGGEEFAHRIDFGLGGSAANTAAVLAALGLRPLMVGMVGDDQLGHRARELLMDAGVGTRHLDTTAVAATGTNLILVTADGERTMVGHRGANRLWNGATGDWAAEADWLHLSAYALLEDPQRSAALAGLEAAFEMGTPVSVDVPAGVAESLATDLVGRIAGADLVSMGRRSVRALPGDPVSELLDAGADLVAVTAGADSFTLRSHAADVTLTPPRVEAVDATGAGDAFVAGLIAARRAGLEPGAAAVLAGALGAATARHQKREGIPTASMILRLLEDGPWPNARSEWLRAARQFVGSLAPG